MKIETYADFIIFKDPKSNRIARRIWEIPPPENGIIRAQKQIVEIVEIVEILFRF
jgi:hypothetical protein